jgi:hypothetical protein
MFTIEEYKFLKSIIFSYNCLKCKYANTKKCNPAFNKSSPCRVIFEKIFTMTDIPPEPVPPETRILDF